MNTVAHLDPWVLEAELLERVAAAKRLDPFAPVLVIVPTTRLADHVRFRLVERFGALVGVEVLHHGALALRIVERATGAAPRLAHEALRTTLFERLWRDAPAGRLRDFVRARPAGSAALRRSLDDLRESGLPAARVAPLLAGEHAELASLFARYEAALEGLARRGVTDAVGLAELARGEAPAYGARFAAILHHGAYELIGVHDALVRALDTSGRVTFLRPGAALVQADRDGGLLGSRLSMLYDEAARPGPVVDRAAAFAHAAGASAELDLAVSEALAAVAAGVPPHEVAIVARSLGPYAVPLHARLDGAGSWSTSLGVALRRDPAVRRALEALAGDGAMQATWGAHASALRGALPEPFRGLLDAMRDVEEALGETRTVSRDEALSWLVARVDESSVPRISGGGEGARVLDAMQARGLTFRHVVLIGMNAGFFPALGAEDPFLPDSARVRLREATGVPLPVASERDAEERLLLAMTLGAARDRILVTWQRSDETGRPLVPSLALREIGRITLGTPDLPSIGEAARALPAHPRARRASLAQAPGLLRFEEETLLVGLGAESSPSATRVLVARRPELAAGVALLEATESFVPGAGRYDGRVARGRDPNRFSVTALETLGRCPLRFFFERILRVHASRQTLSPFDPDARARGERVHAALARVTTALIEEDAFTRLDVRARVSRAKALLREAWGVTPPPEDAERVARVPLLATIEDRAWLAALDHVLEADLTRLDAAHVVPESAERSELLPVPGLEREGAALHARFDRVSAGAAGRLVTDYKTGGDPDKRVKAAAMLDASELQVPLYQLLLGAPVEVIGVAPEHVAGRAPDELAMARFDGFAKPAEREGFVETLRVLLAQNAAASFAIRPGRWCRYCDYRPACRRDHPPTLVREEHAQDARDLRDTWEKSTHKPTLAAVRAGTTT